MTGRGLLICIRDFKKSERIKCAIEEKAQFTRAIDTELGIGSPEMAFVMLDADTIDYVGVVRPGRKIATGQKLLTICHLNPVHINASEVVKGIESRFSSRIPLELDGVHRVPPATFEAFVEAIARDKQAARGIKDVKARIAHLSSSRLKAKSDLQLFEQDAVATAVDVWGGPNERKKTLRSARLPDSDTAPFLSRLASVPLREDPQIAHDAEVIPGMQVARKYQVGGVVLENYFERLTIVNCNRQPLEKTLGVDLIYYNHRFSSFVCVQYKRMIAESQRTAGYRPDADANHAAELQRMITLHNDLRALRSKGSVDSFRLSACPFYFKLCADRTKRPLDEGLVSGMYIPLNLWRKLLKWDKTVGDRGGRIFTWENCKRRMNNSEFITLLRNGWIGSRSSQTDKLNAIIEASLSGKKMVVFAATSERTTPSEDYARDEFGRFSKDEDSIPF